MRPGEAGGSREAAQQVGAGVQQGSGSPGWCRDQWQPRSRRWVSWPGRGVPTPLWHAEHGRSTAPHFTDEDTEAGVQRHLAITFPVPGVLLSSAGETEMNQPHPGVGICRGHRNLCLVERGAGWAGARRAGAFFPSGGAQGSGQGLPGRRDSQGQSQEEGSCTVRVGARGWQSLGLADGRTKGAWGASPALPCRPQTIQTPSCLHTPIPAPPGWGGSPRGHPICQRRLLRLEIKCL